MVRSQRSISKEDASSLLADSGVSLSSPPSTHQQHFSNNLTEDEEEAILSKLCITDDDEHSNGDNNNEHLLVAIGDADLNTERQHHFLNNNNEDQSESEFLKATQNCKQANNNAERTLRQRATKRRETDDIKPSINDSNVSGNVDTNNTNAIINDIPAVGAVAIVSKRLRKSYVCDVCNKEFGGNTDLKRHKLIHSDERPFTCDQCGKHYRQAINLRNHVVTAHAKVKQYTCELCPKAFALKERLKMHMRLHSGEKPYSCPECKKQFARGGQLHQHLVSHHQNVPKRFKCEKCSACFSTTSNLKAHLERHETGPEHYCELCKEHFVNEVFLKAHHNKVHYKLKLIVCDICKKSIEERHLIAHVKTHSNTKSHVCQVCNLLFTQKSQYNVHMRMHTGERPYQCSICCQAFAHSSVLKLHIRKHTGEKPFACMLCKDDVAFSQLAHLKTHMKKIHNQFKSYLCEGCHEFFKIKIELEAHQQKCTKYSINLEEQEVRSNELHSLSQLRFHMAILLKKITSDQKLQQLGYEKRLIDNVIVAALKLAKRTVHIDANLSPMERMRRNVEEFLNWTVPVDVMRKFHEEKLNVENILEKIISMYMKRKVT